MKKKRNLDERELMEIYKIEHYAFWSMFWLLLASIFIQLIFCEISFRQIAGEWIVFMIMALGSSFAYYKGGHYDFYTEPCIQSYLFYSIIFASITDVLISLAIYAHHNYYNIIGFIFMVVFIWIFLFIVLLVTTCIGGEAIKKKQKKLEHQFDDKN